MLNILYFLILLFICLWFYKDVYVLDRKDSDRWHETRFQNRPYSEKVYNEWKTVEYKMKRFGNFDYVTDNPDEEAFFIKGVGTHDFRQHFRRISEFLDQLNIELYAQRIGYDKNDPYTCPDTLYDAGAYWSWVIARGEVSSIVASNIEDFRDPRASEEDRRLALNAYSARMGELKDTVNLLGKIIYEMQIARILFFSEVYSYLQGATTAVRPTTPYFFPFPWAMAFQAPATPFMEKLIVLHDFIMAFLVAIVFFVLSLLFFLITRFVDKHDGPVLRITQIQHNSLLEFVWTVVPFVILLIIFSSSAALIYDGTNRMAVSKTYRIIGNQWYWNYYFDEIVLWNEPSYFKTIEFDAYMLHQKLLIPHVAIPEVSFFNPARLLLTDNVFPVPCKTWLRFLISSKDVIHSWAVPAFGIKCDAVPGRLNEVTAFMDYQGVYFGQCSELCGINHGFMPIHIWAYDAEISLSEYADPSQINRPHYAKPTKVASLNKKPAGWWTADDTDAVLHTFDRIMLNFAIVMAWFAYRMYLRRHGEDHLFMDDDFEWDDSPFDDGQT